MKPSSTNKPWGLTYFIYLSLIDDNPVHTFWKTNIKNAGGYSGGDTPLPIPNRVVKPARADGTAPMDGVGE